MVQVPELSFPAARAATRYVVMQPFLQVMNTDILRLEVGDAWINVQRIIAPVWVLGVRSILVVDSRARTVLVKDSTIGDMAPCCRSFMEELVQKIAVLPGWSWSFTTGAQSQTTCR